MKEQFIEYHKLGLQALTEFVTTSGLKTTHTPISKSWLINQKNVKPILLEIERRKMMVNNVDVSFPEVSDNLVGTANRIDESEDEDVSENLGLSLMSQVLEGGEKRSHEQKVETTRNKLHPYLKEAIMMKTVSEMKVYLKGKKLKVQAIK